MTFPLVWPEQYLYLLPCWYYLLLQSDPDPPAPTTPREPFRDFHVILNNATRLNYITIYGINTAHCTVADLMHV